MISIHAPARGATNASAKKQTPLNISIHAPARGATESRVILQQGYTVFQSTLPRGERRVADSNKVEVKQISIHAPARGATKNYLVTVNRFYISIHAPARGATFVEKRAAYVEIFQSTLPRGERLQCLHQNHLPFLFQSTLPRGERLIMEKMLKSLAKFQSTLPRGERRCSHVPFGSVFIISIHAPARGATLYM